MTTCVLAACGTLIAAGCGSGYGRRGVPASTVADARELIPGFQIVDAEREVERGEVRYSFEGFVRGREVELEIGEDGGSGGNAGIGK